LAERRRAVVVIATYLLGLLLNLDGMSCLLAKTILLQ
jgi:hypothetical protein